MNGWINLSLERDEHLSNSQRALMALELSFEKSPKHAGIVRRHLNRVYQRELALAELALIILDSENQPSNWRE